MELSTGLHDDSKYKLEKNLVDLVKDGILHPAAEGI